MLKGVNKRIIEISNIENEYFYKALLFVNSDAIDKSDKKLQAEANNYISSLVTKSSVSSFRPGYLRRLRKLKKNVAIVLLLLCVGLSAILLSLLLN